MSSTRPLGRWIKIIGKVPSIIPQELTAQLTVCGVSQYESDILASSAAEVAWNLPFLSTLPLISPALDPKANPLKLCSIPSVRRGKSLPGADSSHEMIAPLHPFLISSNSPWGPFRSGPSVYMFPCKERQRSTKPRKGNFAGKMDLLLTSTLRSFLRAFPHDDNSQHLLRPDTRQELSIRFSFTLHSNPI